VSTEDAGSEIAALELSLELLGKDEQTAQEILDALDRIKAKAYGDCEECSEPIPRGRLEAMPHARNCIECQRALEKGSF
jgi:DnaK suppressor protein